MPLLVLLPEWMIASLVELKRVVSAALAARATTSVSRTEDHGFESQQGISRILKLEYYYYILPSFALLCITLSVPTYICEGQAHRGSPKYARMGGSVDAFKKSKPLCLHFDVPNLKRSGIKVIRPCLTRLRLGETKRQNRWIQSARPEMQRRFVLTKVGSDDFGSNDFCSNEFCSR
jgi:hypothetical protein